jgi:hypothetical protein
MRGTLLLLILAGAANLLGTSDAVALTDDCPETCAAKAIQASASGSVTGGDIIWQSNGVTNGTAEPVPPEFCTPCTPCKKNYTVTITCDAGSTIWFTGATVVGGPAREGHMTAFNHGLSSEFPLILEAECGGVDSGTVTISNTEGGPGLTQTKTLPCDPC